MGCLRNVFALVGLVVVLTVCAVVAWTNRVEIAAWYRHAHRPAQVAAAPKTQGTEPGRPSAEALRRARDKENAILQHGGPGVVVLSADEIASLVADGLVPEARRALDSIVVTLGDDRFTLDARVRTSVFGNTSLGPLAGLLNPYEPLKISGPAHVTAPGRVAWTPDGFALRTFPFPQSAIPSLIRALTGAKDGAIPIIVPATVGDLRIRPDGLSFYRRVP